MGEEEEEEEDEGEARPPGRTSVSFFSFRSTCLLFTPRNRSSELRLELEALEVGMAVLEAE